MFVVHGVFGEIVIMFFDLEVFIIILVARKVDSFIEFLLQNIFCKVDWLRE